MSHAQLITCEQLAIRLSQPEVFLLDCRFALDDPAYGRKAYEAGHLPGAHFLDLEKDLSGPVVPGQTGRHPLPAPNILSQRLAGLGLNSDSHVVIYDDGNGSYAARAWWALFWLGKQESVALLDGGLSAWKQAGGLITADEPAVEPGDFIGRPDPALVVDAQTVHAALGTPGLTLIDARAPTRFRGEAEPIDPVAGHVPGASCWPFTENLDEQGRFKTVEQLRERFARLAPEQREVIAYCGSGVTACHNLFAMSLAGFPVGKLYAGSWSEWITDPQRPIASGDGPAEAK
ncbi:sulfurtransferase [Pseudomonas matsuisoli]|uniref:3-mercaptopyruvate sulfurtransferase n=1 Tax=Pseudomonas matsuisoli TaxID=1515666 RepID=A0A917UVW1_9PSED|nr:sulfurtransferase [Pseudomonas matsuisoli]GGJ90301.1 putative 3-mercaptopyruvate sulfurtransferase [Pseudomonas matsuisoli]